MFTYVQEGKTFKIKNYDKSDTFTDFLPAISGLRGIPLWVYLVNRGQCVSSFGVGDKNGAISEFFPANKAINFVDKIGFRSFLKTDYGTQELFFDDSTEKEYIFDIYKLTLKEKLENFSVKVEYSTLCEEKIPAILRKITIVNTSQKPQKILLADGHSQLLPYGINYFSCKELSNLMSAFTSINRNGEFLVFKHEYTTNDSAQVVKIDGGNFYISSNTKKAEQLYVYDQSLIFGSDMHLGRPLGLKENNFSNLKSYNQSTMYRLPCMFTLFETTLQPEESVTLYSAIGRVDNTEILSEYQNDFLNESYYEKKFERNATIIDELFQPLQIKTSNKIFDNYIKSCFFDNLLRGGMPIKVGNHITYVYSRKHGDLEREYNWFNISPTFYSSGSGNYRDVNQNRRNDVFFYPYIEDYNIRLFFNLIQLDGYNPLVVETPKYIYKGNYKSTNKKLDNLLSGEFEIGELAYLTDEELFLTLLTNCQTVFKASFGEGYWTDHFTYNLDLIESFEKIYPDKLDKLLFGDEIFTYFDSGQKILSFNERIVEKDGYLKSCNFLKKNSEQKYVVAKHDGTPLKVNLITKLVGLVCIKCAVLDRSGCALEMEAGKPGWNDSMNGLPALNGSNVADAMELLRLIEYIVSILEEKEIKITLLPVQKRLFDALKFSVLEEKRYQAFVCAREKYYSELSENNLNFEMISVDSKEIVDFFGEIIQLIRNNLKKVCNDGLYPTYFIYEINSSNEYTMKKLPLFLEAQAKSFKLRSLNNHLFTYKKTKESELRDEYLGLYKTSVDLSSESPELGRVMTFRRGLYERESCFLHMHYKFLLEILDAELYEQFYEEIKKGLVCNFDPAVYRRSIMQNSSFIVSSVADSKQLVGRGYQPRLTGANSEILSIFIKMFIDNKLFTYENNQLNFTLSPKLSAEFFDEKNEVEFRLLDKVTVIYSNPQRLDIYKTGVEVRRMTIFSNDGEFIIQGNSVSSDIAHKIRDGSVHKIYAVIG